MRPIPIPDECVGPGMKRYVISAPGGDLTDDHVRPVEALAGIVDGAARICVLVAFEPGELVRAMAMPQPAVWLTMLTNQIPALSVEVADGRGGDPWA